MVCRPRVNGEAVTARGLSARWQRDPDGDGKVAGSLVWQLDGQAARVAAPLQLCRGAEQFDGFDLPLRERRSCGQRLDGEPATQWPGQGDGVKRVALGREPDVLAG